MPDSIQALDVILHRAAKHGGIHRGVASDRHVSQTLDRPEFVVQDLRQLLVVQLPHGVESVIAPVEVLGETRTENTQLLAAQLSRSCFMHSLMRLLVLFSMISSLMK